MKTLYVCLLAAVNTFAASIGGIVADPSGAAIANAEVVATHVETKQQVTVRTSESGTYSLPALAPGRYQIRVQVPGFAAAVRSIVLDTQQSAKTLPVVLEVGQVAETIDVVGQGIAAPKGVERVRMGGAVRPVKLLKATRVAYPSSAKSRGVEGSVVLKCAILTDGTVGRPVVLLSPDQELADAVVEAVKQWRYEPAMLNGVPVEVLTTLTVNFQLRP